VYNEASRNLTIPTIRLGLTTFTNLVVRLDTIALVSVDPAPSTVADKCTAANFSADKYNAIVPGLTLAQVNTLMGCRLNTTKTRRSTLGYTTYVWQDDTNANTSFSTNMEIYFDGDGAKVAIFDYGSGPRPYKSGVGF
jgi:hypothetical protein